MHMHPVCSLHYMTPCHYEQYWILQVIPCVCLLHVILLLNKPFMVTAVLSRNNHCTLVWRSTSEPDLISRFTKLRRSRTLVKCSGDQPSWNEQCIFTNCIVFSKLTVIGGGIGGQGAAPRPHLPKGRGQSPSSTLQCQRHHILIIYYYCKCVCSERLHCPHNCTLSWCWQTLPLYT